MTSRIYNTSHSHWSIGLSDRPNVAIRLAELVVLHYLRVLRSFFFFFVAVWLFSELGETGEDLYTSKNP